MRGLILGIFLAFMAFPVMAAEAGHSHTGSWLKPVEARYVCMMNNKVFEKEQMAIEVDGRTYYGCCPMCKEMLKNDPAKRTAIDPVSGKSVDKAAAVIGAGPDNVTYYFENEENFHKFASGPPPERHEHSMGGVTHDSAQGNKSSDPASPHHEPGSNEDHP